MIIRIIWPFYPEFIFRLYGRALIGGGKQNDLVRMYLRGYVHICDEIGVGQIFVRRYKKTFYILSIYMAYRKEVKLEKQRKREMPVAHRGKQTVKQLTQQNQGVSNIDIQDKEIRQFERIARKYGVDYAVKKDRSTSPPKYMIFFKGRDADAITAAFQEYMGRKLRRETRTSVLERLEQYKDMARNTVEKVRKKVLER